VENQLGVLKNLCKCGIRASTGPAFKEMWGLEGGRMRVMGVKLSKYVNFTDPFQMHKHPHLEPILFLNNPSNGAKHGSSSLGLEESCESVALRT
jgi:hypothetical protein